MEISMVRGQVVLALWKQDSRQSDKHTNELVRLADWAACADEMLKASMFVLLKSRRKEAKEETEIQRV